MHILKWSTYFYIKRKMYFVSQIRVLADLYKPISNLIINKIKKKGLGRMYLNYNTIMIVSM